MKYEITEEQVKNIQDALYQLNTPVQMYKAIGDLLRSKLVEEKTNVEDKETKK